ncbi:MAG: OmpA family protein [Gammaproteobacteria bacterium]
MNILIDTKIYRYLSLALLSLLLFGCGGAGGGTEWQLQWKQSDPPPPALSKGELAVQEKALKEAEIQRLERSILEQNAKIIYIGDDFMLILPTDTVFYGKSPRIKWTSYPLLDMISDYLGAFDKVSVTVAGYTDDEDSEARNKSLSTVQAQSVADYIWSSESDVRLLNIVGYGSARPISSNITDEGQLQNRRIEITFRQLHEYER